MEAGSRFLADYVEATLMPTAPASHTYDYIG